MSEPHGSKSPNPAHDDPEKDPGSPRSEAERPCRSDPKLSEPPGRPKPTLDATGGADDASPGERDRSPSGSTPIAAPNTPADQLKVLRQRLASGQRKLLDLEPLKTEVSALTQRIQDLEKVVDGQTASSTDYKDFYRQMDVFRSEIDCFIPTVRCQLTLDEAAKKCISKQVVLVDARVKKAVDESREGSETVTLREEQYKHAGEVLVWAKKWHDFLKTEARNQATKQRDDLKALKQLADPAKGNETWFYLYEMERLLKSSYSDQDTSACWLGGLTLGTFIECWTPQTYDDELGKAIVRLNEAEVAEKTRKTALEQSKSRAAELEKAAKEALSKRREWILKEIKAECGPKSNSP